MAKKQFIRHLEYYGFPDQNKYSSDINGIDLSDIREKNKEQDEEIKDLEGDKAEKSDLDRLSGTVENLIAAQSEVNEAFAEAISGMSADIEELKEIDSEFAEQISAITDGVNDIIGSVSELDDRVDIVDESISGLSGAVDSIMENYAKKDDVYTKEEIDEMLPSGGTIATQEWVEEQGYLTSESGDSRYAKIEDVEAVGDELTQLEGTVDVFSGETIEKFDEVDNKFDTVNEKIDTFSGEVENALSNINNEIDDLFEGISANTEAIESLEGIVQGNTEKINELAEDVSGNTADISSIYNILEVKANVSDLRELGREVERIDNKKADKEDLNSVSGAVDSVSEKLNQEIDRSTSVDTEMETRISDLDSDVQEMVDIVESFDGRVSSVESGLTKEIADRIQGDLDLIGSESDSRDANTIWGAKNFAKEMKRQSVNEAEVYTDDKVSTFDTKLSELENEIERELTNYATTGYVESRISDTRTIIESDYNTKINSERERAIASEDNISMEVSELYADVTSASTEIAHNATRINSITEWDGSDPSEYDDSGNGVLDVLHREFHEYVDEHGDGDIKEIKYEDGNLIIVYESIEGEKTVVIPIGEIVDLSDYYKKEETDALLDEKLDISAYTDISEQVSANTENIEALSGSVENKVDLPLFNALVEKLGYTDNETLVKNGDHEAAFGEYNISHTSEDASGQTIFSIGNGSGDDDRSNAVEVMKNGDVYLWVEGEFMNINKLLGQLAHEVYDTDSTHNSHFFDGE